MDKPTKIQRTVEFDSLESEAYSIVSLEASTALQSALDLLERHISVDRKDSDYLLLVIDDVRKSLFTVDLILGDAAEILKGRKQYLQAQQAPAAEVPQPALTNEQSQQIEQISSSLDTLRSFMDPHIVPEESTEGQQPEKETEK
tara:strand:+ start:12276 stop:12707 length:432 start_codon:yes stop_codon:yes gene_type:complete